MADEVAVTTIPCESAAVEHGTDNSGQITGSARGWKNIEATKWKPGQSGNPKGKPPSVEKQLKKLLRHGVARDVAASAIAIACDSKHPLCMAAIKWIADRIDGPLERAIRHTLDVPAVTLNVQLTAPRSMPALPEARTIDAVISAPIEPKSIS